MYNYAMKLYSLEICVHGLTTQGLGCGLNCINLELFSLFAPRPMLIGIHTTPKRTENVDFSLLLSGNPADLLEDKKTRRHSLNHPREYTTVTARPRQVILGRSR